MAETAPELDAVLPSALDRVVLRGRERARGSG
jgi:hypothetical protein